MSPRAMTIDDDDGRCWCECKQNVPTAKSMAKGGNETERDRGNPTYQTTPPANQATEVDD